MTEPKITRPIGIYILSILILWIAGWNGLRLGDAIYFWSTLKTYGASPLYISISGGTWLMVGCFIAWSLWQGKNWGRIAVMCATIAYTAWYWFDRLVLQEPHANWPFVLIVNIFFLLVVFFTLFSNRMNPYYKRDPYGR